MAVPTHFYLTPRWAEIGSSPDLASGYGAFGLPFGKKIEAQKPRSSVTDQLDQLDLLDQPFFGILIDSCRKKIWYYCQVRLVD